MFWYNFVLWNNSSISLLCISNEDEVPLESLLANEDDFLKLAPVEVHHRERRVTCDLASGFGVGHSLCAAHCITKGYTGGSCTSKGICSCRKWVMIRIITIFSYSRLFRWRNGYNLQRMTFKLSLLDPIESMLNYMELIKDIS